MSTIDDENGDEKEYEEQNNDNASIIGIPPSFPSILSPRSLQIKLKISLPNLPSPSMSSPRLNSRDHSLDNPTQQPNQSTDFIPPSDAEKIFNFSDTKCIHEITHIVSIFDSLPLHFKFYLFFHLLKRSPLSTLQFVQSLVTPALKRNFLSLLPPEICFRIVSFLDVASLGRCHAVCKSWHALLTSSDSMHNVWYPRLEFEGWLPEQSVSGSYLDYTLKPDTPEYYKSLFKSHYIIKQNWLHGRFKKISFPSHSFSVVTCVQFDSECVVSGSDDQTINIYDIDSGYLNKRLCGHDGGVWALQYWKDVLVSGSTDRTVRVWDMKSGECTSILEGHTSTVRCLTIVPPTYCHISKKMLPANPLIVTGSRDSTLRVWNLPTNNSQSINHLLYLLHGHNNSVRAVVAKCNVVISGSYDCTVRSWDLNTGKCIFVFRGHREKVYSVDYCHYSQKAASGSMDTTVRIWCTKTGSCLFLLEGHTSLVGLLEMSPHFLVSAAADATLRVWSTESGKCLACLTGHSGAITCFHHDPYFNRVVSGSEGGIKVWELSSDDSYKKSLLQIPIFERQHILPQTPLSFNVPSSVSAVGNRNKPSDDGPVNGKFICDLVTSVQGVWRVKMSERYLVAAVQKEDGKTWFEILDFGCEDPKVVASSPKSSIYPNFCQS